MALKIGDAAFMFSLKGTDGKLHALKDVKNDVVVVIFTCNHCPYAQAYQDRIVALQRDYPDVAVIAINPNDDQKYPDDSFGNMVVRAKQAGFNFPYLRDESQDIAKQYGAQSTPHAFVLDKKRVVRYKGRIDDSWDNPAAVKTMFLRNAIEALLNGTDVPVPETQPVGCSIKWK